MLSVELPEQVGPDGSQYGLAGGSMPASLLFHYHPHVVRVPFFNHDPAAQYPQELLHLWEGVMLDQDLYAISLGAGRILEAQTYAGDGTSAVAATVDGQVHTLPFPLLLYLALFGEVSLFHLLPPEFFSGYADIP
jgi:hypothetical protein